jgi:hypothetical protein
MTTPFFPTNSKKVSFAQTQEVLSGDLNTLSTYLHQIIKDFSINVIGASTELGSTISGMVVTAPNGGPVSVGSGLFIYSATPDTGATSYTGTLVNYPGVSGLAVTSGLPAPTKTIVVGIDIQYTEIPDTVTYTRNFYNTVTNTIDANLTPIDTIPSISTVLTFGTPSAGTPVAPAIPSNYCRLATFVMDSSGNITNLIYTLTYIWDIQTWAGTANTFDPTQMKTLSDSLSALRYQISALIGSSSWLDVPATSIQAISTSITTINASLATILSDISTINTSISTINSEIVTINSLIASLASLGSRSVSWTSATSTTWSIPAGVYLVQAILSSGGGAGGNGDSNNPKSAGGGGGGGGAVIICWLPVNPGSTLNIQVGGGGSTGGGSYPAFAPNGGNTYIQSASFSILAQCTGGQGGQNSSGVGVAGTASLGGNGGTVTAAPGIPFTTATFTGTAGASGQWTNAGGSANSNGGNGGSQAIVDGVSYNGAGGRGGNGGAANTGSGQNAGLANGQDGSIWLRY